MENPDGPMNPDSAANYNAADLAGKLSEDESRKMILESYEKAGVDLPLVSLETVLDREVSEDDARQTGAPRFRKFLNRASSAMANRPMVNRNHGTEEGPDDEYEPPSLSSSYTSNSYVENEASQETRQEMTGLPVTPKRPMNESNMTEDMDQSMEEPVLKIVPDTPESLKNNCHQAFDLCCPKSLLNSSPSPTPTKSTRSSPSDKYVMSNLQLAEGFDDEQRTTDAQPARDVPALMDMEDTSMMDDSYAIEKPVSSSKTGVLGFFKGSRRFRLAVLVCCFLHIVLIALIIAFVTNADNESHEAGISSSDLSQAQAGITSSSSTDASTDFVVSKTLMPDLDLESELDLPQPELESESNSVVAATNSSNSFDNSTVEFNTTVEENSTVEFNITVEEDNIFAEQDNIFQENAAESNEEQPTGANSLLDSCVNSLDVSTECVGAGSELLVFFESCTPRIGDWVAIYDASADPRFLLDEEVVGWLYTCGDRFCEEATEKETLSFTRATERAEVGTYRAHLIREGDGPTFSSIASSSIFRIVTDADVSC